MNAVKSAGPRGSAQQAVRPILLVRSRERQQQNIRLRWNWLPVARRQELLYRFNDRLNRLFDSLGLTGMCMVCCAVMPAGPFSHRQACPECGRHEIATPYGC